MSKDTVARATVEEGDVDNSHITHAHSIGSEPCEHGQLLASECGRCEARECELCRPPEPYVDISGPAPVLSCGRCGKRLSEFQLIRPARGLGPCCLDCLLARYRRGDLDETARADVSVDLLLRLADGILYQ